MAAAVGKDWSGGEGVKGPRGFSFSPWEAETEDGGRSAWILEEGMLTWWRWNVNRI